MKAERASLLDEASLTGRAWCETYTARVDRWLEDLFVAATANGSRDGEATGVALVAVGGYGRGELCPHSDIDVLLLHAPKVDVEALAAQIWYPVWDAGLKLGHAVRTPKQALALAQDELDAASALLDVRCVAGDESLVASLADAALSHWQRRSKQWLSALARSVDARHARAGEVAFLLEPDLKDGRGGLRDVHALRWAEVARRILFSGDHQQLDEAYGVLLDVRVELHRRTRRPTDQLLLQDQDAVAAALGDRDADELMARLAAAARTIAWTSDDTWTRVKSSLRGPSGRVARTDHVVGEGLVLREGEVHLDHEADPSADPVLALRAAACAARVATAIDRPSLERLAQLTPPMPEPWPAEARQRLVELLRAGPAAINIIEALDQRGLWVRVLPEWEVVQSRPQRNAFHRYTVDRHLMEAASRAAGLAERVARPDLLVVSALLHDLGKGHAGDHVEVGVEITRELATRMDFPQRDVDVLVRLIEHHLLLMNEATRRDLDDPDTIDRVAKAVRDATTLDLLAALTEADALATGPAAWGPWKAELVGALVSRVAHVLAGGEAHEVVADFPTAAQRELLVRREQVISGSGETLVVVAADRPGLFARVAGVLALHGLDVLAADAYSSDEGMAIEQFRVEPTLGPVVRWDRVTADLERALAGRLAIDARLAEKARAYDRPLAGAVTPPETKVTIDNTTSAVASVVDVQAADGLGVLYRITRALADLDLDIRSAKVQTLGPQVVDAFYVVDRSGAKLADADDLTEIERAVAYAVGV